MSIRLVTAIVASLLLLSACGRMDVATFEERYQAAYCEFWDRCGHPLSEAFDEDYAGPCESWFAQSEWQARLLIQAGEAGTMELTADAEACLDIMEDPSAGCAEASRCYDLYAGQVEAGGACHLDAECVDDAHCETRACPGTCVADAPEGTACSVGSECVSGVCDDGACAASRAELGTTCDFGSDCKSGRCNGPDWPYRPGTCMEPGGLGDSCAYGSDCGAFLVCLFGECTDTAEAYVAGEGEACGFGAPFCQRGLVCAEVDPVMGEFGCQTPVGSGEACTPAFPDPCPAGQYCDAEDGRCLARPGDGEPCGAGGVTAIRYYSSSYAFTCAEGHYCVDGLCRARGVAGEPCAEDADCWAESCVDGTCEALACGPDWR